MAVQGEGGDQQERQSGRRQHQKETGQLPETSGTRLVDVAQHTGLEGRGWLGKLQQPEVGVLLGKIGRDPAAGGACLQMGVQRHRLPWREEVANCQQIDESLMLHGRDP